VRTKVPFSAFLLVASIFLWAQQSSSPIGVPRTIAESKSTMPISNLGGRVCVLSEESDGRDVPLSEVEGHEVLACLRLLYSRDDQR